MTYCVKCGAQVEDGIGICPQCGAVIPGAFDTPEPQNAYAGQSTYSGQENSYSGQTYSQENSYSGQTYSQENSYSDQAYSQENSYSGQAYSQGNNYNGETYGQQYTYNQGYGYSQNVTYDYDPDYFPEGEVKQNKLMGILSYLGILVLIPIIAGDKNSDYLKQHMNQGLVLFIIESVLELAEKIIDDVIFVGGILSWAVDIAGFAFLILAVMGIISAAKGTRKPLPTIGNIQIFK